jgi:hypothetical protein
MPQTDQFAAHPSSPMSAAETWAPITPSDTVDIPFKPKGIAVGSVAGSFVMVGQDDVEGTFYGAAGACLPYRPKRIKATGMTGGMTFVGLKS